MRLSKSGDHADSNMIARGKRMSNKTMDSINTAIHLFRLILQSLLNQAQPFIP